jgi:hypothetical protein
MAFVSNNIDHGKYFDWGRTSSEYAKYRDIYPVEFNEKLADLGLCKVYRKSLSSLIMSQC